MSFAENLEELPNLTALDNALLDARLAAYRKDPDAGSSWEHVEARLLAKLDG
jgi:putative addiction module component (TIGR02574 family)